jgi:chemotaxis protein methyltransferase CheR
MFKMNPSSDSQEILWSSLSDLITDNMGIFYPREKRTDLQRGIAAAMTEFGMTSPESCARWLLSAPLTKKHISILARHLTVGETYFFRDKGSFRMLEHHILPQLLHERAKGLKQIRIWSAGCCSGEEPYSIAILLSKMIPNLQDWNITILATDIDPDFLHKASLGIYSEWSFRNTLPGIREKFFKQTGKGHFEIIPAIKNMVTFGYHNLVKDPYPSVENGTCAMDIILCRNVLMYFSASQTRTVLQKLNHTLLDSGWLFLSPSELPVTALPEWKQVHRYDTIVLRKNTHPQPAEQTASIYTPVPINDSSLVIPKINREVQQVKVEEQPQRPEQDVDMLYRDGHYEQVIQKTLDSLSHDPKDIVFMTLLARSYANIGQLDEAILWCKNAVSVDKLNAGLYYLQATMQQEQGLNDAAVISLNQALYLDSNNALVHYSLGNILWHQNKHKDALRHFNNALSILREYPQDNVFPESEGITAGGLINLINATIAMEVSS